MTRTPRTPHPVRPGGRTRVPRSAGVPAAPLGTPLLTTPLPALRAAIAAAHGLDPAALREHPAVPVRAALLDLLGPDPVRTGGAALARIDGLARELVARMAAAGWDETAVPAAVTSVLAASVPAAEAVLRRHARPRSAVTGGR